MRILETEPSYPDVLIHKDIDDNGNEIVNIKAVGFYEGTEGYILSEDIIFDKTETALSFIRDYSLFSANKWCKDNNIKYSEGN